MPDEKKKYWDGDIVVERQPPTEYPDVKVGDFFTVEITDERGVAKQYLDCPVIQVDEQKFTIQMPKSEGDPPKL